MIYKRLDGESDEALIFRVCSDKDMIGTWQDVRDILNPLLGTDFGESTFRKKYTAFKQIFEANRDKFSDSSEELLEIRNRQRELELEKVRFRDERREWSRQNYLAAREQHNLDLLAESLGSMSRIEFPTHDVISIEDNGRSMLIMLEDLHIGKTFDTYFGKYNTDVARQRLGKLLVKVKEIAEMYGISECFVSVQGDLISGNIHKTIQITNRENVIDQIKIATELISSFLYELTRFFNMVTVINVSGNHSRLDKKDDAIHDERFDDLVMWAVDLVLKNVMNFYYCTEANIDSGIALFPIRDKYYCAVHGDYDNYTASGVQQLITMIHAIPHAVLFGHKHTAAVDECNGIKMVRGGSLVGSGDQYTVEKRLGGKASQMVCICTDKGIESYHPIELE